jgi:hypothetical protein
MGFRLFMLLSEMSLDQAYQILDSKPADDPESVKKKYRRLLFQHHPDRMGDVEKFKMVQSAWETIHGGRRDTTRQQNTRSYSEVPPWETDSRSTYHDVGTDFRNLNYVKKTIYEEAKKMGKIEPMTVWAFDGNYQRGVFSVFGNDKIYPLIGHAMETWNSMGANSYATKAVLVTDLHGYTKIIRINGKDTNIFIPSNSFNRNPFNDTFFTNNLKEAIQRFENPSN